MSMNPRQAATARTVAEPLTTSLGLLERPGHSAPPIFNDITRRRFIIGTGATALMFAACSRAPQEDDSAQAEGSTATRTIEHFAGTTEVPAEPQRIVTLQDQNALLPLLELGVKPIASAGLVGDDGSETFRRTDGLDTSGIEFIGVYGEPNLEAIAAVRPDLIVSDEYGGEGVYEELSRIAPTVFVRVFERPLTLALLDFADVVGRRERADELHAAYQARIASFRGSLGEDIASTSVSLLSAGDAGTFYQADSGGQAQYTVMLDLGLPRPTPQRAGTPDAEEFGLEQLPEHDADAVIVNDFGGESADPGVNALIASPLYANLAATRAGQSHVIDATRSVGSAWARMDVFLDELERILLEPGFDHGVVDEEVS